MMRGLPKVLSLLYCYAQEDALLRDDLDKHLAMLRRLGWIQSWSDRNISAGANWQQAMDHKLETADLIVLLVSADFINSDYCYGVEMQQALRRHQAGEAIVIPILLRPVEWEKTHLGVLQALPRNGQPVTSGSSPDETFKQIAMEIRLIIEVLRRPIILASLSPQRELSSHLANFFASNGIPTIYVENMLERSDLQEMIRESSTVVFIASPETYSAHLFKEAQNIATMYQRHVLSVWIPHSEQEKIQVAPPEAWNSYISIILANKPQEATFLEVLRLVNLQRYHPDMPNFTPLQHHETQLHEPRNPYKSLRAFNATDANDFFGRTKLIAELVESVEAMITLGEKEKHDARLLTVIGPSGSGKSSLVMAGLLPHLQARSDSEAWIFLAPIVPGEHPLEALALTLFKYFPERSLKMLRDDLEDDEARSLHLYATALARQKGNTKTHILLVIDQFEEIFTLTSTEKERQQFINLLVNACTQRQGSLLVVLTLRADFYDRPMQYPALYLLIEKHQTAMLPMTLKELNTVITQPAALPDVQLIFEGKLIGDLLFDVQGQIGALPLLQFTLDQLFQHRGGHQLTLKAYHEIGGVKGALSQHAEQTYQELPSEEHRISARTLFLRLIDPGMTEQDTTRRRAVLSEFTIIDTTRMRWMQETLETFIKARLLTTNQNNGTTTVEVSHEAVIREWNRLADWLHNARDDIHFQQAFSKDVMEWEKRKRPRDRLYRGLQLKEAQMWAKRNIPSSQEVTFLRSSTIGRMQFLTTLLVIALLLISSMGGIVWYLLHPAPSYTLVTNMHDGEPGSLRWCIANALSGMTITFDQKLQGTITFSGGNLTIVGGKKLTIRGPLGKKLAIRSGDRTSVISVSQGAYLTISNLSIQDSRLTIDQSILFNRGNLTVNNSSISNNSFASNLYGGGGSISNSGILTLNHSSISNNSAMFDGGGILNDGIATLNYSTVSGNSASTGGGISNDGIVTINNSIISGNSASKGGGISNDGTVTINNSIISNNIAHSDDNSGSDGGGISSHGGVVILNNSTISNNSASGFDGGDGGAISSSFATLTVNNSTISGNSSRSTDGDGGGGISSLNDALTVNNSTISGNSSTNKGGGIYINIDITELSGHPPGKLTLVNNTILGNSSYKGGGLSINSNTLTYGHPVNIGNSIIASNFAQQGSDISGPFITKGYNLFQNTEGALFVDPQKMHSTDQEVKQFSDLHIDPLLGKNGGATRTHALFPGSPAIDTIPLNSCYLSKSSTDQRGVKRPQGAGCDIGAYEYQART